MVIGAAGLFAATSCVNTTSTKASTQNDTIVGYVADGTSMHNLQLAYSIANPGDTINLALTDSTKVDASMVVGNIVKVVLNADSTAALSVENNDKAFTDFYTGVIGDWTMPDPIDKTKKMGITLGVNGAAGSINMASLQYKHWDLSTIADSVILIQSESMGNGQTIALTDTMVVNLKATPATMTVKGTDVVYTKQ